MPNPDFRVACPRHLNKVYEHNHLIKKLLAKCNSQQFLAGKAIGEGCFLTLQEIYPDREERVIEIDLWEQDTTLRLYVKDVIEIDYDHCIIMTVEYKYILSSYVCLKNYNMGDVASHETFTAILDDILSGSPYSFNHAGASYPTFKPEQVRVDGKPVLEAIDYILTAIGHTFHDNGDGVLNVVVPNTDRTEFQRSLERSLITHKNPSDLTVVYRYDDISETGEQWFHEESTREGTSGLSETTYYPFMFYDSTKATLAVEIKDYLVGTFRLASPRSFQVIHYYESDWASYYYTSVTFIDVGDCPRLIYQVDPLPRLPVPDLFPGGGGGGSQIQYTIDETRTADPEIEEEAPYTGLTIALVTITVAPCDRSDLIGTQVDIVDHSGCVFDIPSADLEGIWGWANEGIAESLDPEADPGTLTPCHWVADDRCCTDQGE